MKGEKRKRKRRREARPVSLDSILQRVVLCAAIHAQSGPKYIIYLLKGPYAFLFQRRTLSW